MRKGFGFHDRHSPFRFNPATLFAGGEQGVWYDPSDLTTLFQDSAGTTPVTAVGQPVGRILDKSGQGNHAFQTTPASRPTLNVDGNGRYYLLIDGIDDSLLTNSINFTTTNKMTVWTGVRKLSDAALGMLMELGASVPSGNFYVLAPNGAASAGYQWRSRGTIAADVNSPSTYAAPITNVLTGIGDIAAPQATLRINGAQVNTSSASQGTGNFGNYPLYIGRRNNASLPFNGRLYGLIVLGAAASNWQVFAAEQYMAQKTGISII